MVAYKKLSNIERSTICNEMVRKYYENSLAKKLFDEYNKEYKNVMTASIPDEVKEFAKKYPNTIKKTNYDLWTRQFVPRNERYSTSESHFSWPYFSVDNVIIGFLDDEKMNNSWYCDYENLKNYVHKKNPELVSKIVDNLIPQLNEIDKFDKSLTCALEKINTLNQLKNDFPEAYSIYVEKYGKNETKKVPCNQNKSKDNFCDTIEKLRAEYNK